MDQNLLQQTNAAFGIPAAAGEAEGMPELAQEDAYDDTVRQNLEQHLNHLTTQQKAYLVENLTPEVVTVLGIVNGKEVYDYFVEVFTQINGNSNPQAQQPGMDMGSQPMQEQQMTQPQPQQATATPAPPMV